MNEEQLKQVQNSFKHGDYFVFRIGDRVFVSEEVLKHRKEATVEFKECYEIDETCFEKNGEYLGETLNECKTIILEDCLSNYEYAVGSFYYPDELLEELNER